VNFKEPFVCLIANEKVLSVIWLVGILTGQPHLEIILHDHGRRYGQLLREQAIAGRQSVAMSAKNKKKSKYDWRGHPQQVH
jgi:hypothetical protein